jgi:hypothetical protein
MKVLIACEESQTICKEFRKRGHEAYSCDVVACSGGHPEWHIQDDVLNHLEGWDLIIAHPPCTYLSTVGAPHLFPKGVKNEDRYAEGVKAAEFFMDLYDAPCEHICVENPLPMKCFGLPKATQKICPSMFGHRFKKRTMLWLKGLPPLVATAVVEDGIPCSAVGGWYNKGGKDRQRLRSVTFKGIAEAMAEQWSEYLNEKKE